ncbi:hypothetical protein B0P06_002229 [Clostridium saccharoperbutylacetonicum]|uniref:Uncharacterized protein n=1 Tax=Clostridium saccharoperbutylacetonicum N1-4(HMT) TaxID=931276 RepID=M1N7T1_9CLOT|nr:hypothetical protein [Clostridium saccharoperbutylacetonicum]AGF59432.1 hypothetical protein Cspa_c57070 [Clostridium saccharoperbutylacetonicum N1-4(HMT)]NRT59775.1 hypothetical protein [Clostridium saccharoperbutylacetonicum]NSB23087.1 hypothetical protein [Clostridium saccharoperbutylacetonicum]NSB42458.1 hypothetical protein [Clostridium saccharoperbutylacetonicum]
MEKYIDKLYALLHSPIITPYNLLENAKLDNYNYVKYYKGSNGLIAEMQCVNEDAVEVTFFYEFNIKDELNTIIMKDHQSIEVMFNRDDEIKNVKDRIHEFTHMKEKSIS